MAVLNKISIKRVKFVLQVSLVNRVAPCRTKTYARVEHAAAVFAGFQVPEQYPSDCRVCFFEPRIAAEKRVEFFLNLKTIYCFARLEI